jgi:group I intron endonuclease
MNFVYLTTNLSNNKQYIGSHNGDANDNYLGSGKYIKSAIRKYGIESFKRVILEECNHEDNLILEEKYIKEYNTLQPNGYNISPTGGHGLNGRVSNETKQKIKNKQKGKKKIDYYIEKHGVKEGTSKYNKWIELLRSKSKGYKHSPENIEKIRQASIGRICTDERKRKIGEANKIKSLGNKNHLGHKHTDETKTTISNKMSGRVLSNEHKRNISKSCKK